MLDPYRTQPTQADDGGHQIIAHFIARSEAWNYEVLDALPERGVTVHSGDMGYTIGPFAGSARCPGRCVNLWMNG